MSRQKRAMDVCIASVACVPSAVLIGGLACFSTLKEHEAPFFAQVRLGRENVPFVMHKLRTMPKGTPEARAYNLPPDTVTPFQQKVRNLRLNELPQLWDILAGHMSVVGPRPHIFTQYEETMDKLTPRERVEWLGARALCRPGLIDPYIVGGSIGDNQPDDPVARAYADIRYTHTATFKTDLTAIRESLRVILPDAGQPAGAVAEAA